MGIMVCSSLWVMQDLYHHPYQYEPRAFPSVVSSLPSFARQQRCGDCEPSRLETQFSNRFKVEGFVRV